MDASTFPAFKTLTLTLTLTNWVILIHILDIVIQKYYIFEIKSNFGNYNILRQK